METEMKLTLKVLIVALLVSLSYGLIAGDKEKKVKTFTVSKVLPYTASEVWAVVGEDYGRIAYSHPRIVKSDYINGSLKAEEGAERVCHFNDKGTRFLHERMVNYSPDEYRFTNTVFKAGKFPVDPEVTRADYIVKDLGDGTSELTFDMQFRTKPAFMGGMMKNNFKKLIKDYFIAIEHHIATGEQVTKENFKDIKKRYVGKNTVSKASALVAIVDN